MKITEPESIEDKYIRLNVINEDRKRALPSVVVLLIICVIVLVAWKLGTNVSKLERYGVGNPYNCASCKSLGFACNKHRGFNTDELLKTRIAGFIERYKPEDDEEQVIFDMYGYGNRYNTECDFCNTEKKECYSCETDRRIILDFVSDISNDNAFKSKLCDDCWKLGYAHCEKCKEMLVYEVYNKINCNQ